LVPQPDERFGTLFGDLEREKNVIGDHYIEVDVRKRDPLRIHHRKVKGMGLIAEAVRCPVDHPLRKISKDYGSFYRYIFLSIFPLPTLLPLVEPIIYI